MRFCFPSKGSRVRVPQSAPLLPPHVGDSRKINALHEGREFSRFSTETPVIPLRTPLPGATKGATSTFTRAPWAGFPGIVSRRGFPTAIGFFYCPFLSRPERFNGRVPAFHAVALKGWGRFVLGQVARCGGREDRIVKRQETEAHPAALARRGRGAIWAGPGWRVRQGASLAPSIRHLAAGRVCASARPLLVLGAIGICETDFLRKQGSYPGGRLSILSVVQ